LAASVAARGWDSGWAAVEVATARGGWKNRAAPHQQAETVRWWRWGRGKRAGCTDRYFCNNTQWLNIYEIMMVKLVTVVMMIMMTMMVMTVVFVTVIIVMTMS
jgi:hypothetical protein